jgi:hypothetical protein
MLKNILSVVAGIMVAFMLIAGIEMLSHQIYSLPKNIDPNDKELMKNFMSEIPIGALIMILVAYMVGAFGGGIITGLMASEKRTQMGITTGVVLLILGISNLLMIPHPIWFSIASILLYVPAAYLGVLLSFKLKPQ